MSKKKELKCPFCENTSFQGRGDFVKVWVCYPCIQEKKLVVEASE